MGWRGPRLNLGGWYWYLRWSSRAGQLACVSYAASVVGARSKLARALVCRGRRTCLPVARISYLLHASTAQELRIPSPALASVRGRLMMALVRDCRMAILRQAPLRQPPQSTIFWRKPVLLPVVVFAIFLVAARAEPPPSSLPSSSIVSGWSIGSYHAACTCRDVDGGRPRKVPMKVNFAWIGSSRPAGKRLPAAPSWRQSLPAVFTVHPVDVGAHTASKELSNEHKSVYPLLAMR